MLAALEDSAVNYPQPQWVTSADVEKCKARLVARDFTWQEGVDGSKTLSDNNRACAYMVEYCA